MVSILLETPSRVLFGAFPSTALARDLEADGVTLFVDLTQHDEDGTSPYQVTTAHVKYPIREHHAPSDWDSYRDLIVSLACAVRRGQSLYIHCRAGHSRSSTVCASLLCQLDPALHPEHAVARVAEIHSRRAGLSARWKRVRNPLTRAQHVFLYKFFSTLFFTRAHDVGFFVGFSASSPHPLRLDNGLEFPNLEAAFQYLRDPRDEVYLSKLLDPRKSAAAKFIGDDHWAAEWVPFDPEEVMYSLVLKKIQQHPEVGRALHATHLKRLVDGSFNSHPDNLVGRALMRARDSVE